MAERSSAARSKSSTVSKVERAVASVARRVGKPTAKQTTPKQAAAKPAAKKTTATKTTATKPVAKKATAKKPAKQTTVKGTAAKRTAAKQAPAAKKTTAKKTTAKKTTAQKTTAQKATAKQPTVRPVRRPAAKASVARPAARRAAGRRGAAGLKVRADEQPWTVAELNAVRGELRTERERLRGEIAFAQAELDELLRDSGDGSGDDQADAGSKTFEREAEMSVANNSRDLLMQVEHALARIDDGSYGRCESCGQPIGKARLQAFPRATLCLACKQREERR